MEHVPGIPGVGPSVNFVTKDRVSDRIEMHADLMGAASEDLAHVK